MSSDDSVSERNRFTASTDLKHGVVEDAIPEDDVYRYDDNPVFITRFDDDREYRLHIGSRVGLDTVIMFDSVCWDPGEFQGTLWFKRTVRDQEVTVGSLDWHACFPANIGLVGEWFLDQIDLSEYRAGVECPECRGEVLHLPMHSACETADCDFFCEGHLREDPSEEGMEGLSDAE